MKKFYILLIIAILAMNVANAQLTVERVFGDTGDCAGLNIVKTFDSGYLITACKYYNYPGASTSNLFIIKIDSHGDSLWSKEYIFDSASFSKGIQTYDSGYVFTGQLGTKLLIYKVNKSGDSLWIKKYYFGGNSSEGLSIIESHDHSLYIVGFSSYAATSSTCCYPVIIRTDSLGNLLKIYGIPTGEGEAYEIVETPDSNFVISSSMIWQGPPEPKLTKIDTAGNLFWHKDYQIYSSCYVNLSNDNGFVMSGYNYNGGLYLIKTDSIGSVVWNKTDSNYSVYYSSKVTQSNDSGFLMVGGTGDTQSDLILFKVDSQGNYLWKRIFGGVGYDFGNSVVNANNNGFAIVGYTNSFGTGKYEVYFIITDSLGYATSIKTYPLIENQIKIYPNPTKDNLTIETNTNTEQRLEIINLIGQTVYTIYINKKATVNTSAFANGVYILKIYSDKETMVRKFIKE